MADTEVDDANTNTLRPASSDDSGNTSTQERTSPTQEECRRGLPRLREIMRRPRKDSDVCC